MSRERGGGTAGGTGSNETVGRSGGRLLALEGLDGVGKTTQARMLAEHLGELGLPVLLTREPTQGFYGRQIREIIRRGRGDLTPEAELALFLADRREHVREVIAPALRAGLLVITDRYYYSTMAYQGALGLDPREIEGLHAGFAPRPELVIILELPLEEIGRRLAQRGGTESPSFENLAYLSRVAAIFDRFQKPGIVRVTGLGSVQEVHARIRAVVQHRLALPEAGVLVVNQEPPGKEGRE